MAHGPYVKKEQVIAVKKALEKGTSISSIAALTGRSTQTICRIKGGDFDWMLKDPPPPGGPEGRAEGHPRHRPASAYYRESKRADYWHFRFHQKGVA